MWDIDFHQLIKHKNLPLITSTSLIILLPALFTTHHFILQILLSNCFNVKIKRKQHNNSQLQFSFLYHLSIVILGFSQLHWNLFDLYIWIFSYAWIGILRCAIFVINVQRKFLINDFSYNNQIIKLLVNSKILGVGAFIFSIIYIISLNVLFHGVMIKLLTILCFPSFMLLFDSLFLFIASRQVQQHLIFFYNQNISKINPTQKIQIISQIISFIFRFIHYLFLLLVFSQKITKKNGLFDYLWIIILIFTFFNSLIGICKSISKYRNFDKLIKNINRVFTKNHKINHQVCTICLQQLFNSYKIIQCGHLFHYKCLFQWVQTKLECPICRTPINLNA